MERSTEVWLLNITMFALKSEDKYLMAIYLDKIGNKQEINMLISVVDSWRDTVFIFYHF